jgi:hypothetical protein
MDEADLEETKAILNEIPGGRALLAWLDDRPAFGDAEILELRLVRKGHSVLRISHVVSDSGTHSRASRRHAVITFVLTDMMDVSLEGFGVQNVIGGMTLRRTPQRPVHNSLVGIGLAIGSVEMKIAPCAGAFGLIRCTISEIKMTSVADYQRAN